MTGKLLLVGRLAVRDLRWRTGETVMMLVAITAATATLTLGLVLHGVTTRPYQATRTATAGPDAVATAFPQHGGPKNDPAALASLAPLRRASGVTGTSGPFPVAFPVLTANGHTDAVLAEGRAVSASAVDQPKLTQGSWVRSGAVVLERSFADALGVRTGDEVTLSGRRFRVAGVAVTAAFPTSGIGFLEGSGRWPNPGLVWLTQADARSLATTASPLGYVLNVRLARPGDAVTFADRFDPGGYTDNTGGRYVIPWQDISRQDGVLVRSEQQILLVGSWLLAAMALGSLAILVGGRMTEASRRVGLLKAVGSTPALVAGVLLAEYLVVAVLAAAIGLVAGRLVAPSLTNPGTGLLGTAPAPPVTPVTAIVVAGVAVGVAAVATLIPALRAVRASTVSALADSPRLPRRGMLTRVAARLHLPVSLLVGALLAARRPRRTILSALSVAVTVSGIVAVLYAHATVAASEFGTAAGEANAALYDVGFSSRAARADQVLLVVTLLLAALAAVNAFFVSWAAVRDSRHSAAVVRSVGATVRQVTAGLSSAQVIPALAGAALGIPGGIELFMAASHGGASRTPPLWSLAAVAAGAVLGVASLVAVPASAGARTAISSVLTQEG